MVRLWQWALATVATLILAGCSGVVGNAVINGTSAAPPPSSLPPPSGSGSPSSPTSGSGGTTTGSGGSAPTYKQFIYFESYFGDYIQGFYLDDQGIITPVPSGPVNTEGDLGTLAVANGVNVLYVGLVPFDTHGFGVPATNEAFSIDPKTGGLADIPELTTTSDVVVSSHFFDSGFDGLTDHFYHIGCDPSGCPSTRVDTYTIDLKTGHYEQTSSVEAGAWTGGTIVIDDADNLAFMLVDDPTALQGVILVFRRDPASGALSPLGSYPVNIANSITLDALVRPKGGVLYVTVGFPNQNDEHSPWKDSALQAWKIDATSGTLALTADFVEPPSDFYQFHPSGRYALAYGYARSYMYAVNDDGTVGPAVPMDWVKGGAHFDSTGKFLITYDYLNIYIYSFDPATGAISSAPISATPQPVITEFGTTALIAQP